MADEDAPLDLVALLSRAGQRIDALGGAAYLSEHGDLAPSAESAAHNARRVHEVACLRRAILAAIAQVDRARAGDILPKLALSPRAAQDCDGLDV